MEQEIKFCTTSDNVRIAYSSVGEGPPFVKAANWLNHLEHDLNSPVWRHLIDEFAHDHRLIRYDERGNGLSDWDAEELSLDAFINDLESVVDAVGVERFPLFGISQGGAVAIAYAHRHPERVSHLILFGPFAQGWQRAGLPPHALEKRQAEMALITHGWGNDNPAVRQFFTTMVIPDSTSDEANSFNEMQQLSTSAKNAARLFDAFGKIDVLDLLPALDLPVLVLHCRGDAVVRFEEGRRIASLIPNARFVPLESKNHILLEGEPAWPKFVEEVRRFLGRETVSPSFTAAATQLLKTCPNCSRTYADVEMVYCLDDGTRLVENGDEGTTKILSV